MKLRDQLSKFRGNRRLADDLMEETQQEIDRMQPINILVAGKTGSGKSTLINALFRERMTETGVGQPVTQHVVQIKKKGMPLTIYDTRGLELSVEAQHDVLSSLSDLLKDLKSQGEEEAIDVIYYCINSLSNRVESIEIELIEALAEQAPVILVLTQSLGGAEGELSQYVKGLDLPVAGIVSILAEPYQLQNGQILGSYGLQALVDKTLEVIPGNSQRAFINAQRIDLNRKVQDARSWAKSYVATSFGIGFLPIPISDAALLVPMQITMLAHITSIFGLSLDKAQIVSIIAGIGGTGGATMLGKTIVSSALKWLPGVGTVTGGVISGSTASALTIALAYSYIEVLKQITIAEETGRDLPLRELQRLMNQSMEEQLAVVSKLIPEDTKDKLLPQWLKGYLD